MECDSEPGNIVPIIESGDKNMHHVVRTPICGWRWPNVRREKCGIRVRYI